MTYFPYQGHGALRQGVRDVPHTVPFIGRAYKYVTVTIAGTAALSDEIDMRELAGGMALVPDDWTSGGTAKLGFKVAYSSGGDYYPLYDKDGNQVTIDSVGTVAAAYELPPEVYAAHYIKLWSTDGAGGDAYQVDAREIYVAFKG
jgi:hypothetical protein